MFHRNFKNKICQKIDVTLWPQQRFNSNWSHLEAWTGKPSLSQFIILVLCVFEILFLKILAPQTLDSLLIFFSNVFQTMCRCESEREIFLLPDDFPGAPEVPNYIATALAQFVLCILLTVLKFHSLLIYFSHVRPKVIKHTRPYFIGNKLFSLFWIWYIINIITEFLFIPKLQVIYKINPPFIFHSIFFSICHCQHNF